MSENAIAKAGRLLMVDEGQASNYEVKGVFVILMDFFPYRELKEYLELNKKQSEEYHFEEDQFLNYLISKGYLLEIDYDNLYLGAYSMTDDFKFHPFKAD